MPADPEVKRATPAILAACAVFLAYAGCFLYFFVDDEAIPLVYAHNLLRGRGLVYTVLEGRVEGYSDFLHVLWCTVLLTITRAFEWSRLTPLLIGKGVSLVAGVGLVSITGRTLARARLSASATAAGLGFVSLAGPLALWSTSSLETTVVALTVFAFALAVWREKLTSATVLGILIVLERIDGPIYVGVVLAAALAGFPRRWRFIAQTTALVALPVLAYHGWRFLYFGSLLSAPLAAKILYRIAGPARAVAKAPDIAYLQGLLGIYGWTGLVLLATAAIAAARDGLGRMAIVTVALLAIYAERVDDWMFGWRFAVAMTPFVALILAQAIGRLGRRPAIAAAIVVCAWSGIAAVRFARLYQVVDGRPIFWTAPGAGQAAWLGRYYELLAASRPLMRAGDRIAYNQAGLLPYMLDLENVDDLGICSGFVARLPTTDVYYTGVGRYSPLTNAPALYTAHAYLLYRNVRFLVTPIDLLLKANHGRIPDRVLDDGFERVPGVELRDNVLYRRTAKPMNRFATDPNAFAENVAHYSHIVSAAIDGRRLGEDEIGPALPFLRGFGWARGFSGSFSTDVTFAREDEEVTGLFIAGISSTVPSGLTVVVSNSAGRPVYRTEIAVPRADRVVMQDFPAGTRGTMVSLAVHGDGNGRLALTDVRVQGQTAPLAAFVRGQLRFPSPQW